MKKIFYIVGVFFILISPSFAVEDVINDADKEQEITIDNVEIPENEDNNDKDNHLLLKDFVSILDYKPEININGKIIDKIEFGGAYQGTLTFNTYQGSSNTKLIHDINVTDVYFLTKFADKKTEFKFMINPVRTVKDVKYLPGILQDIYISTKPTENTKLLIGHSRVPIGKEAGTAPYYIKTARYAQIGRTHGNVRALGVKYMGDYKYMDYNIGLYDSSRFFTNMFKGAEFASWVNFKPLANLDSEKYGKLTTGFGYDIGKRYNSFAVLGTSIEYEYKKFLINAEYSYANGYNGVNNSRNKAEGFYTTAVYKIHPKVELVGRYDVYNPNKRIKNNNVTEITAGVNYYLKGDKLKFILNYVFRLAEKEKNSNALIFLTQFMI